MYVPGKACSWEPSTTCVIQTFGGPRIRRKIQDNETKARAEPHARENLVLGVTQEITVSVELRQLVWGCRVPVSSRGLRHPTVGLVAA
jgi:hypothetical protein